MRQSLVALLTAMCLIAISSCRRGPNGPRYVITYYDRNGDGIVDYERHEAPGWADGDWSLTDTDFNGDYDVLLVASPGAKPIKVSIPVPFGVKITKKLPEHVRSGVKQP